eukprot:351243-Chlamydomonas_euryale.AAC.3
MPMYLAHTTVEVGEEARSGWRGSGGGVGMCASGGVLLEGREFTGFGWEEEGRVVEGKVQANNKKRGIIVKVGLKGSNQKRSRVVEGRVQGSNQKGGVKQKGGGQPGCGGGTSHRGLSPLLQGWKGAVGEQPKRGKVSLAQAVYKPVLLPLFKVGKGGVDPCKGRVPGWRLTRVGGGRMPTRGGRGALTPHGVSHLVTSS